MAIEWTPWFDVPLHRRLEVIAVVIFHLARTSAIIGGILTIYLVIYGNIYWKTVLWSYLLFVCYDWRCGDRGGRTPVAWIRNMSFCKHYGNYFPIDLVKTVDLPSNRNYLVALVPHGFLCIVTINFISGYSKWSKLFPGIRTKVATNALHLLIPYLREFYLSFGGCSASSNALRTLLTQSNDPNDKRNSDGCTSTAVGLFIGGFRELRYSHPDKYCCVVRKRRGFIRIALETGASLVPAISFGENNIYRQIEIKSEFLKRIMKYLNIQNYSMLSYFRGRGIFQYNFGFIPLRHPITTVIGAPIHLKKIPNPSSELVDQIHERFCTELIELFETHKCKYIQNFEHTFLELI